MFSFQTLHVLCEFRKFLPKYRIMWPMPSYLFWNLANLFSNSSLGSEKLNQNRHSLIKSRLTDLNNFISSLVDDTALFAVRLRRVQKDGSGDCDQYSSVYDALGLHTRLR